MINTTNKNNNITSQKNLTTNEKIGPPHPFRFLTQNIRGLNTSSKQEQILNFMSAYNVNIMGLAETKLNNTTSKHLYKNNKDYTAYFDSDDDSNRSAGVGLILSKYYNKNVHKVQGYKGRLIF